MSEPRPMTTDESTDPLWDVFVDPPDDARPRAWWHWMDGNVDPDGIRRDLHWLHEVGVRGAQLFDGGMGGPLHVDEPVRPGTETWNRAIETATRTAAELGMELAVATSSGWSASGGPWVRPADAMKKVVWSECEIEGDGPGEHRLPDLPDVPGPYQQCPRWGSADDDHRYAIDWRVVAFPSDPARRALEPARIRASSPLDDVGRLTDGDFGSTLSLPRDPDGWSSAWIEQEFADPVTVRSVTVGLPGPRGFGAAPPPVAVLQASDDGVEYRDIADLPPTTIAARTAAFPAVTARRFRLVLSAGSAADALPGVSEGVRLPPVLRPSASFEVAQFALRTSGRIHQAEAKAGFGVVADYFAIATPEGADVGSIDPRHIVDLTDRVHDGVLHWTPPAGTWTVLRLGASLTGQTNGPAPADATGLEVDKLDGARVRAYLDVHLRRFGADDTGSGGGERFRALLSDSIEAGSQNWTDRVLDHFARLQGYDASAHLPALAGHLVGGPEESDRFLFDYRATLAALYAEQYYGTLADEAHRRGMAYYAEALEDGRPQLGDDLAMRAPADVPMGAMWTFDPAGGPRPTYVADLKGASSVAHVLGRARVGAEAFTSFDRPWSWTPRTLKPVADLQLALGVTRFCIHTSPHQPIAAPPPGVALAPFLGQAFTVNETWAQMARPWIDYLARCSAVLAMGSPAVDIAVFIGEEAPVTGMYEHRFDDAVPNGFDFDYVWADALQRVLRVRDGMIHADGATYGVLFLGGSSDRMTLPTLLAVERLLDGGATIVGRRPTGSPSHADDPERFATTCDRIWGPRSTGRVLPTADLAAALHERGLRPALEVEGPPVRTVARIVDTRRVTFLANPLADRISIRIRRPESRLVAWDPVDPRRVALDADAEGWHVVHLAPFASLFVLESPRDAGAVAAPAPTTGIPLDGAWTLDVPGLAATSTSPQPRRWTDVVDEARAFSGVATYRHRFRFEPDDLDGGRILLDLGDVSDLARVRVNGADCGVAWTPPFRVDISDAVRAGSNLLEVEVATPWRNRLIAEAASPSGTIPGAMTTVFEPTAEPLPAGLAGPVRLVVERDG
ncbi:glycosyl hydrolase [Agromyces tropicus]|uniref:Glycosyl hydrolase n=1 Tax=Agromyces tropicus TaxID=555371 RepID=A0ABN2U144_9MICO